MRSKIERSWTAYKIGTWLAVAMITYFLLAEHRAHIIQFLPYLLLLACPLMHFFMHKNHDNNPAHSHHIGKKEEL